MTTLTEKIEAIVKTCVKLIRTIIQEAFEETRVYTQNHIASPSGQVKIKAWNQAVAAHAAKVEKYMREVK